ncbi:murein L,D-transpeptidase catalytic domain family protein [Qipengyuania sp. 1NDH17]|uniref:Murein L,D-transpeptidase catalytic domain family protein n=1 Tax=Qipengyuania polymorpha TaxID=2867234 RepID=A0ABS7J026_9SPHN|nr:murein L,D-transpeptidase catalytic domain family protein [Qipengyuania polymorpha]MBX7459058.1 murein L,D-transpeptidase catalytic domain family protein [Qipengyuania polymorpha]
MKRRDILRTGLTAGAALTLPARVFAQASATSARDKALFDIARRELARAGDIIWKKDIVGIADFGLHSSQERFHFVDLVNERVESFFVSHGTGSDSEHDGWLKRFSNIEGSEATSRGAYMTRSWYRGKYGTSIRLDGLDPTNDQALSRAIVMHPAEYARPEHITKWGRLGRSNGCFALGPDQFAKVLLELSGGRLLYADSLGLKPDGSRRMPPVAQVDLLRRPGGGTFERTNPGVY